MKLKLKPHTKKFFSFLLVAALVVSTAHGLTIGASAASKVVLNVYNWGEYIDLEVIDMFEEQYPNIKVNYTTYDSNEAMYAKIVSGAASYDIVIPSDYMISKLIEEDLLAELNFDNIPNYKYIGEAYKNLSYDPENKYSVPYLWGTWVIIYNSAYVSEEDVKDESINLLWNEKYAGKILMFDNPRDAFGLALMFLGYSLNTENPEEWQEAAEKLNSQKSIVQAYVMDAIFDKMGSGEAWIAPYYAGDAIIIQEDNPDIDFYIPSEGTNLFFDAMCILKTTEHQEEAEAFINFMCDPEISAMNAEAVGYATPNTDTLDLLDEEITDNPLIYPDTDYLLENSEVFVNLPTTIQSLQSELWTSLKIVSSEEEDEAVLDWIDWFCIISAAVIVVAGIYFAVRSSKRKKLHKSPS
ncbi:MAG: spermidine/putrescine ABC transporter substrate-binding protein [Clostridiales bacterium]|nr:spermidine/putrescine ABC transporter substrate-binding protein [Clostridiales bacterium]